MLSRLRSDIPLVLAALFIAFVIWLIAKQGDLGEDTVQVPVQLENVAPYMDVTAMPSEVTVKVRYPHDLANRVSAPSFTIAISVKDRFLEASKWVSPATANEVQYSLDPRRDVRTRLPDTVLITEVNPKTVTLKATLRLREASVKVATIGTLPGTLDFIAPPRPEVAKVLLTGAPEALRNLTEKLNNTIETTPIDLRVQRNSHQEFLDLVVPEGLILLGRESPSIAVDIGLTEHATTRTLAAVPIAWTTFAEGLTLRITPPTANIVLQGPPSKLDSITADSFQFGPSGNLVEVADRKQESGLEVRLANGVPSEVAQKVRILEWKPARITVEYVRGGVQNTTTTATLSR